MHDNEFDDAPGNNEPPSKSALKREMTALQKLGEELAAMPPSRLAQLTLSEEIIEAINLYRRLKQREARRRQLQFIGKQMRREDVDGITATLAGFEQQDQLFRQHFHRIEALRDSLLRDGDQALDPLLEEHPGLDRQFLRQTIRQAKQEASRGKPPAASRKLFRYLREQLAPTHGDSRDPAADDE
ncbi:MAG: ribosome biogenesis factor YjgA [Porticoccaceae bacterium]